MLCISYVGRFNNITQIKFDSQSLSPSKIVQVSQIVWSKTRLRRKLQSPRDRSNNEISLGRHVFYPFLGHRVQRFFARRKLMFHGVTRSNSVQNRLSVKLSRFCPKARTRLTTFQLSTLDQINSRARYGFRTALSFLASRFATFTCLNNL